jgi:WD40 repeat protein
LSSDSSPGVPPPGSLDDLKPVRPPSELAEATRVQKPRPWPLCCGLLIALGVLLAAGLTWLWIAAHPSHAKNGARVLSAEPGELDDEGHYVSLSLRYRKGKLQSVSSLGNVWEEDDKGVLRPAFGLADQGIYYWPISVQGSWAGLPSGSEICLRNLESGELDSISLGDKELMISSAATGGAYVAGASEIEGGVRTFAVPEGKLLWDRRTRSGSPLCLTFAGEALAVGTARGKVELFESQTGKPLRTLDTGYGRITALAASSDGRRLLVGCNLGSQLRRAASGEVQLWDLASGSTSPSTTFVMDGVFDEVSALAFSSDGAYLAAGRSKGGLQVWDASGALLGNYLHDDSPLFPKDEVLAIAFGKDRVAWSAGAQVFERELGN